MSGELDRITGTLGRGAPESGESRKGEPERSARFDPERLGPVERGEPEREPEREPIGDAASRARILASPSPGWMIAPRRIGAMGAGRKTRRVRALDRVW